MARISLDPPRTLSYRITEWFIRRRFGDMMDPVRAVGHNGRVGRACGLFELQVARWNTVPRRLKDLAVMAAAVKIGCSWCVDFGAWESHTHGVPLEKLEAVPRWRESDLFSARERLVMAYAEAMTADPPGVTDELVNGLREFLDEPQLVELTMIIAVENTRSRFNSAAGLVGQGFKDRCEVPPRPRFRFRPRFRPRRRRRERGGDPAEIRRRMDIVNDVLGDLSALGGASGDVFEEHRNLLFAVAYRMLGTVADAEDVVQDVWLKWSAADRSDVAEPKAYLVRIATNLALDRLRSARVQRESYVGPWLPEPLLTTPDVAEDVTMAESVSMAMLVVLETLTPLERAVFVLREVFGFSYTEIATTLDRSEVSVRQLGHRAREHVQARRPRFEAGAEQRREVLERFFAAALGGDLNELMEVLAPDVKLWTDGGGKVRAARRAIDGVDKAVRWLIAVVDRPVTGIDPADMTFDIDEVNGAPGIVITGPTGPLAVVTVDVTDDGRIGAIHLVVNPDKLRAIADGREHPL